MKDLSSNDSLFLFKGTIRGQDTVSGTLIWPLKSSVHLQTWWHNQGLVRQVIATVPGTVLHLSYFRFSSYAPDYIVLGSYRFFEITDHHFFVYFPENAQQRRGLMGPWNNIIWNVAKKSKERYLCPTLSLKRNAQWIHWLPLCPKVEVNTISCTCVL